MRISIAVTVDQVLNKFAEAEKISPSYERVHVFSWNDMLLLKSEIERLRNLMPNVDPADSKFELSVGLDSAQYDDGTTIEDDKKFNQQWDVSNVSWVCPKCGQKNAHWAGTCGRCGDA